MFGDFQQGEGLYHKQMKAVNIVIAMCIKLNTHIHLLSIDPHYIFRSIWRIVWSKVISSQVFVCPRGGAGWFSSMHHRSHDQGVCPTPWMQIPWMHTALDADPLDADHPPTWDTTGYGQQADDTHPAFRFTHLYQQLNKTIMN